MDSAVGRASKIPTPMTRSVAYLEYLKQAGRGRGNTRQVSTPLGVLGGASYEGTPVILLGSRSSSVSLTVKVKLKCTDSKIPPPPKGKPIKKFTDPKPIKLPAGSHIPVLASTTVFLGMKPDLYRLQFDSSPDLEWDSSCDPQDAKKKTE